METEFNPGVEWYLTMIYNAYTKDRSVGPVLLKVGQKVWDAFNESIITMQRFSPNESPQPPTMKFKTANLVLNPTAINPYHVWIGPLTTDDT